jgi:hypothetical protein
MRGDEKISSLLETKKSGTVASEGLNSKSETVMRLNSDIGN